MLVDGEPLDCLADRPAVEARALCRVMQSGYENREMSYVRMTRNGKGQVLFLCEYF